MNNSRFSSAFCSVFLTKNKSIKSRYITTLLISSLNNYSKLYFLEIVTISFLHELFYKWNLAVYSLPRNRTAPTVNRGQFNFAKWRFSMIRLVRWSLESSFGWSWRPPSTSHWNRSRSTSFWPRRPGTRYPFTFVSFIFCHFTSYMNSTNSANLNALSLKS